ncbi:hypothetical protein GUJ93_ZPchr0008g13893 [Zizania palustris]|uniref:Uncharacterized protein n=1 Tax=Zizania palustris TaxID=103762 RepID=A0A8J5RCK3_ZIZPA|nr:hypothetical protein GUJ93_ZPchr0008g13893 [Zizania palustris]
MTRDRPAPSTPTTSPMMITTIPTGTAVAATPTTNTTTTATSTARSSGMLSAMGCSLLVSMASLVCLFLLPVIFFQGKPSKTMVDALAVFGAGAMLGDSFLHQLPHAFGGGHSHAHHEDHNHSHKHSHAHSLKDLSVGLSVLFGIVLFFIVEKIVRYAEDNSRKGTHIMGHGHHHHHHKRHDTSDMANLNNTKKDHEDKGIDQAEKEHLHDGTIEKTDGGAHDDPKATFSKVH